MRHKTFTSLPLEPLEARALMSVAYVDHGSNNQIRTAQVIQVDPADGQASVVGQISRGDQDVYQFNPPASGLLQVSLSDSGRNPVEVAAYTSSGHRIFHTSAHDGTSAGSIALTADHPVFFRVRGLGRGTGSYQIVLSDPSAVVNPGGPSGTPMPVPASTPTSIALDASGKATLTGTISAPLGSDSYSFTAPKSGRITFSIRKAGSTPLSLTVTDSSGRLKLHLDTEIPSYIAFIFGQQGETYTVRIALEGNSPAPYTATVSQS